MIISAVCTNECETTDTRIWASTILLFQCLPIVRPNILTIINNIISYHAVLSGVWCTILKKIRSDPVKTIPVRVWVTSKHHLLFMFSFCRTHTLNKILKHLPREVSGLVEQAKCVG